MHSVYKDDDPSTLAFSCRGLNDRKVDPVVIAHAKAVIDSNFCTAPICRLHSMNSIQLGCILLRLNILLVLDGERRSR